MDNSAVYHASLQTDALEQLVLNPTASNRWHGLIDAFNTAPTPEARTGLAGAVRARIGAEGVEGFFRATFLATLEDNSAEWNRAGELLQTLRPFDADRVMAFTVYQWGLAVLYGGSHASLRARLLGARVPELVAQTGRHLAAAAAGILAPRTPSALRKVAVVAPFIGNANHPPTEMALQQAELLVSLGLEVTLFSCQTMLQPQMTHYFGGRGWLEIDAPDTGALAARLPPGTNAVLSDSRMSMMRRWLDMLVMIEKLDPDLIMFVGLSAPLLHPLYAARPVLALGIHALSPMAPVDAWLTADPAHAGCTTSEWGDALPPAFGHYHPYRIRRAPQAGPAAAATAVSRAQLGIAEAALAMVTVGARLEHEISGPWAVRMLDILARHPQLTWVLAGGAGALPPALASANPAQLCLLPHRTDLPGVLRCCDLYVNPPRLGGGLSAAEAMAEGLPVLALAGGDAGSKLAGMAQDSEAAYFGELEALLASPERRAQVGAAMQAHFVRELDLASSGPSLMQACLLAQQRFRERQAR